MKILHLSPYWDGKNSMLQLLAPTFLSGSTVPIIPAGLTPMDVHTFAYRTWLERRRRNKVCYGSHFHRVLPTCVVYTWILVLFTEECWDVVRLVLRESAELDVAIKQTDLHYVTTAISKTITQQMTCKTGNVSVQMTYWGAYRACLRHNGWKHIFSLPISTFSA